MAHLFEVKAGYTVVDEFRSGVFLVEYGYAPDTTQLELLFDPSEDYYQELVEKIADGTWEHFIARVRVLYDGREMAAEYMGSVVHEDPAVWFEQDEDGTVDDMVQAAMDTARNEAMNMLEILKKDFLGVDTASK
jgi:hypothetical protein